MNSTHRAEVLRLGPIARHPNADTLGVTTVHSAYTVVVKLDQWHEGDLAVYVTPDSLVPLASPLFSFLDDGKGREHHRVKVKKLRGVFSQGLLIPAPEGAEPGDDVAPLLGIAHYEPPMAVHTGGNAERAMSGDRPVYDLESFRRYGLTVFSPGEPVVVTEKIHGCNARYTYQDGRMWCGSRNQWKAEAADSIWWQVLAKYPGIRELCEDSPGLTLYGEVFGQVQDLRYGRTGVDFVAFDALEPGRGYLPFNDFAYACDVHQIPVVPVLHSGPFDPDQVLALAEGPSTLAPHVREGCVVRPLVERWHETTGRVHLKVVGNGYLERA
jgi:RNA ligase (TIGR02306 family)